MVVQPTSTSKFSSELFNNFFSAKRSTKKNQDLLRKSNNVTMNKFYYWNYRAVNVTQTINVKKQNHNSDKALIDCWLVVRVRLFRCPFWIYSANANFQTFSNFQTNFEKKLLNLFSQFNFRTNFFHKVLTESLNFKLQLNSEPTFAHHYCQLVQFDTDWECNQQ